MRCVIPNKKWCMILGRRHEVTDLPTIAVRLDCQACGMKRVEHVYYLPQAPHCVCGQTMDMTFMPIGVAHVVHEERI